MFFNVCKKPVEVAPYWNVNKVILQGYKAENLVEVAPYWNVNEKLLIFQRQGQK